MLFIRLTESKLDDNVEERIEMPVYVNAELIYKLSPLSYQNFSTRLSVVGSDTTHIDVKETHKEVFTIMRKGIAGVST